MCKLPLSHCCVTDTASVKERGFLLSFTAKDRKAVLIRSGVPLPQEDYYFLEALRDLSAGNSSAICSLRGCAPSSWGLAHANTGAAASLIILSDHTKRMVIGEQVFHNRAGMQKEGGRDKRMNGILGILSRTWGTQCQEKACGLHVASSGLSGFALNNVYQIFGPTSIQPREQNEKVHSSSMGCLPSEQRNRSAADSVRFQWYTENPGIV